MSKVSYTTQDIRNEVIAIRDELVANLKFILECIHTDRMELEAYRKRFGDTRYRPVLNREPDGHINYGNPTELVIEPLASKYRATVNSILQSLRLITNEILPEDNPEGEVSKQNNKDVDEASLSRKSRLREQFSAGTNPASQSPNPTDQDDSDAELVESENIGSIKSTRTTIQQDKPSEPKTMPWRTKAPKFVPNKNVVSTQHEEKPIQAPQKKELTTAQPLDAEGERMRAELNALRGGGVSRMASIRDKYRVDEAKTNDEDADDED